MNNYIPKWHKELEIFCKIKPLLILEGNILDVYRYPADGSIPKGSVLRLPEYLHYFFKDNGYKNIVLYDSMQGFYNTTEDGYIENFSKLADVPVTNGTIKCEFKGKNSAPDVVRRIFSQNNQASAIIMNFTSRYISSPDNLEQAD